MILVEYSLTHFPVEEKAKNCALYTQKRRARTSHQSHLHRCQLRRLRVEGCYIVAENPRAVRKNLGCVHNTFAVRAGGVERGWWMTEGFCI